MTKRAVESVLKSASGINLADPRSTQWLARNLSKIQTKMRQSNFIQQSQNIVSNGIRPGQMLFFGYSPKTKSELMFWDEFPITIYLHPQQGGFLGVNFHYLPPPMRARFLDQVLKYATDSNWAKNLNKNTKIKVTYPIMKNSSSMSPYKFCIKRYYLNRVVTKIALIPPEDWKTVPFFPLDQFKGASRVDVWALAR